MKDALQTTARPSAPPSEGLLDVAYADRRLALRPAAAGRDAARPGPGRLPNQDRGAARGTRREVSPRVLEAPARLDEARRELDLYFEGKLTEFDLPLDWQLSRRLPRASVLRAINRIPYGQTRTYTEMARSAGNERAVRAAGTACGSNPIPIVVPCHRVLRSGGGLGGYGGGLPMKEALLELEGVLDDRAKGARARRDRCAGRPRR